MTIIAVPVDERLEWLMADGEREFEEAADPFVGAHSQDSDYAAAAAFNFTDDVLFGDFGDGSGADHDPGDEFDFIRLSSGASSSALDEHNETLGIDNFTPDLQSRFADFAPDDSAANDGGRSAFRDMVDRRLAQMADGGDGGAGEGHWEKNGYKVSEGFGGQIWDQFARGAPQDHGGARLTNPGAATEKPNSGSPAMTMAELQDRLAEVALRYEQEKQNATLDAQTQARYLDEELKLLNAYESNPATPLNEGREVVYERLESFLEAERKIMKENSAPPSQDERAPQPETPNSSPVSFGDFHSIFTDGGRLSPTNGASIEFDIAPPGNAASGQGNPVSPYAMLDVDLPDGFDNVGEFELV